MKTLANDASFTGEALHKGGLALFGTMGPHLDYPLDTLPSSVVDSVAWQYMTNKLTALPACPPDSTKISLTTSVYDYLQRQFALTGEMDEQSRILLRGRQSYLPGYLLVASIEVNRTWDEMDADGKRGTAYRYMTIRVNIYEVTTGKMVWSTRISRSDFKISEKNEGLKLGPLQIGGDEWDWRPPPPDALDLLGKIFEKLGEALAKKG